jgi:uncharacterized membrane protein YfcA
LTGLMVGIGLGLLTGVISGLLGIGGGVLIVPGLVLLLGSSTQRAVGASLAALLLPVGGFAVLRYARSAAGVSFAVAAALAVGLVASAGLGAMLAVHLDGRLVGRAFEVLLLALGVRFLAAG